MAVNGGIAMVCRFPPSTLEINRTCIHQPLAGSAVNGGIAMVHLLPPSTLEIYRTYTYSTFGSVGGKRRNRHGPTFSAVNLIDKLRPKLLFGGKLTNTSSALSAVVRQKFGWQDGYNQGDKLPCTITAMAISRLPKY